MSSVNSSSVGPQSVASQDEGPGVLFALAADDGIIKKRGSSYRLEMQGANDLITWFEDRPGRSTGYLSLEKFSKGFDKAFAGDPPNSALIFTDEKNKKQTIVIEHKNFKYNKKTDKIISFFDLNKPVDSDPLSIVKSASKSAKNKAFDRRLDEGDLVTIKNPSLFMDDLFDSILSSVGCLASGIGTVVTAETGIGLVVGSAATATECTQAGKSWIDLFS
jgi:hypothetical protein